MLTTKQVKEIKEHLEKAQNPLFFFDNDPDGLCSFLLLQRFIGRGKGFPIRSFPGLGSDYIRKVSELDSDYIFILDKPVVSKEFFDEVEKINIPVVWIDHHDIDLKDVPDFVSYYNPLFNKSETNEPVTALCYQVTQKKEDSWLGVIGCISDKFMPDFYAEFAKNYPDLSFDSKEPFDILYKAEIGKISKMFTFSLMDRTTNVIQMLKFLMKVKTPYEILEDNSKNYTMHKRFNEISKKYNKFIEKAHEQANSKKLMYFQYGGDLSMSGILSNELSYRFPDKITVVARTAGVFANMSIRGKNIRDNVLKSIEGLEGATGGGHEDAVGARMKVEDLEKFKENFEKLIED